MYNSEMNITAVKLKAAYLSSCTQETQIWWKPLLAVRICSTDNLPVCLCKDSISAQCVLSIPWLCSSAKVLATHACSCYLKYSTKSKVGVAIG